MTVKEILDIIKETIIKTGQELEERQQEIETAVEIAVRVMGAIQRLGVKLDRTRDVTEHDAMVALIVEKVLQKEEQKD